MSADVEFRTSGSSGAAKRIVRTEASLTADAASLAGEFAADFASRPPFVCSIPADHMYGALWRVRLPAALGARVWPATVLSAEELLTAKAELGRFVFVTTPSFLEKLLVQPDAAALKGAFAAVVTSGSLLRRETALAAAEAFGVCPTEIYGSTETGSVAWRRRTEGDAWRLMGAVSATALADGRISVESPFAVARPFVLSDAVEFLSPRTFRLLGRTDRMVKILEELVSLPDVEARLEAHPSVARAAVAAYGEGVPRLGALIVLSDAARASLAASTAAEAASALRRDLLPDLGAAFPRRIRFVREIPADARGKTTAALVRDTLALWCREPAVTAWRVADGSLEATLVFPPDCECFDGHFPTMPILPGVAQLYFLGHFARQAFPDYPAVTVFRRLKFQRLVHPHEEITLAMRRTEAGAFDFRMSVGGETSASGLVERGNE